MVKNLAANAGDADSISGSGRYPGGGNGNLLQYSCLENSMDRGSLVGCSSWGCKELDPTEHTHTHTHTHTGDVSAFKLQILYLWV